MKPHLFKKCSIIIAANRAKKVFIPILFSLLLNISCQQNASDTNSEAEKKVHNYTAESLIFEKTNKKILFQRTYKNVDIKIITDVFTCKNCGDKYHKKSNRRFKYVFTDLNDGTQREFSSDNANNITGFYRSEGMSQYDAGRYLQKDITALEDFYYEKCFEKD